MSQILEVKLQSLVEIYRDKEMARLREKQEKLAKERKDQQVIKRITEEDKKKMASLRYSAAQQDQNKTQQIPQALQEELEREANNTTLARFIRNLESRIYAQLSRQLVDNLFGETQQEQGILELEGNTIEYSVDGDYITLKITDEDGNETIITLPIGDFSF